MTPNIIEIQNEKDLNQKIETLDWVVVDFWAPWCGPCKRMESILEEAVTALDQKVHICKVNIDTHSSIATEYSIKSLPTFMLFSKGKKIEEKIGSMDKETFVQWIRSHCSCD